MNGFKSTFVGKNKQKNEKKNINQIPFSFERSIISVGPSKWN
jgi:hypothetical protein